MFGISILGKPFRLRGVIVRYENGIQTVKTESREREFQYIQCMGHSLIVCPTCSVKWKHKYNPQFQLARPCEHVKVGTEVIMKHVTRREGGIAMQGFWTGRIR